MLHRFGTWLLDNHGHRQLHARFDLILPFSFGQYNATGRFVSNRVSSSINPSFPSGLLEAELQEILEILRQESQL